jgi:hypothetical protein
MRLPIATDLKTRTGAPANKDARLINAYVESKGPTNDPNNPPQTVVRKRLIAQGGVSIGLGVAQGMIGIEVPNPTPPFYPLIKKLVTVNNDIIQTWDSTIETTWSNVTNYNIGDLVVEDMVDYWAKTNNVNKDPVNNPNDWNKTYVPAVGKTYAVWGSHSVGSTLSNGNKTVSGSSYGAFSTISKSTGKWYWEYTFSGTFTPTGPLADGIGFGIGNTGAILGNLGAEIHSWGYFSGGNLASLKMFNSIPAFYGSTVAVGDVIGVALDMDGGNLTFYLNGVSLGVAYSGITGSCFADVVYNQGWTNICAITANFGATPLTYIPPAGFNSGLYV